MTLIEELEQAAERARDLVRTSPYAATALAAHDEVNALRRRIEHVKRLVSCHARGKSDPECSVCQAFAELTGDL